MTELTSRVNGMGTEIKWETIEAVVCRDGRVGMPRLQVIESELCERDKTGPEIKRKGDVHRGESGDDVVFGGAHVSFIVRQGWHGDCWEGQTKQCRRQKEKRKFPKGRGGSMVGDDICDDVA